MDLSNFLDTLRQLVYNLTVKIENILAWEFLHVSKEVYIDETYLSAQYIMEKENSWFS